MIPADHRLAAAVAGDRQALALVAAELLPLVRNVVRYAVRGDDEVDDIAQEALVAILKDLPGHRGEGSLEAWASTIALRVAIRWASRRRQLQRDDGFDLIAIPDPGSRPDDYATRRLAATLLDQLPDDQRKALVMRHVLEFSVEEIAEEVGIPFETVRSRLRLGMSRLRSLYAAVS